MNIALQMAREENFAETFCSTLQHFLRWRDQRDYDVVWNGGSGAATLYLHDRLGIATPLWKDPRQFRFVWDELKSGKSVKETIARRLYLAAHLAPGPTRRFLASSHVTIEPAPPRFNDGFYVPGGNQLRWFDQRTRQCFVALKRGFPSHYFDAQLDVRSRSQTPSPAVLETDLEAKVFVEEIVDGRAIDDPSWLTKGLEALEPLSLATTTTISARSYAATVIKQIENRTSTLEAALTSRIGELTASMESQIDDDPIETCITHGDLNRAHVLVQANRVLLVDWEHAARRQRPHDELSARLRPQLPERFFQALAARPKELDTSTRLLLLEGLLFHCKESDNPRLQEPTPSLIQYVRGLEKFRRW